MLTSVTIKFYEEPIILTISMVDRILINQKSVRVLQINAVYGVSSTGRNCLDLDKAAESNGIEMFTAYAITGPFIPVNGYIIGNSIDRKMNAFFSRLIGLVSYASIAATYKLLRYIDVVKPDVIHLNNLHSNYLHLGILLHYIAGKKIATVLTLHDCWFYTGRCVHYTKDNCKRWMQKCGKCPRLKKDIPSWGIDQSEKMLKDKERWFSKIQHLAIVGVSEWITSEAKKSILGNATDFFLKIYNWVDLDIFKPDYESRKKMLGEFDDISKYFLIIGVASLWVEDKRLQNFIELAKMLNHDERIIIVGSIPKKVIIPYNIIHIKETSNQAELAVLYSAADVLINFSHEESFGKVTAEALASGTPVIVNEKTANPELVGLGCGYVVDTDDLDIVYNLIKKIKNNGKYLYSSQCRMFSVENFEKNINMQCYFKLYHKLKYG